MALEFLLDIREIRPWGHAFGFNPKSSGGEVLLDAGLEEIRLGRQVDEGDAQYF